MTRRLQALLLGVPLLLMVASTGAAPLYNVSTSIEAFGNSIEGIPGPKCGASSDSLMGKPTEWWVTFAEVSPDPPTAGWKGISNAIRCGRGAAEETRAVSGGMPRIHYIMATVSMIAAPESTRLGPEKVIHVQLSLSIRKLSEISAAGEPTYEQSTQKRSYFFPESGTAFLPLIVANGKERESLKVHEALIGVRVALAQNTVGAAYGSVSVSSDVDGAELLLDGGVVGRTSARQPTVLTNVPVGDREVSVHDAAGRVLHRVVLIERNRTAMVSFRHPDPARKAAPYRLVPLGKNVQGYEEFRREMDGARVVRIPAGEFLMGNRETEGQPLEHMVDLSEFIMDKTAVTWGQFKTFADATGASLPPDPPYWGIHDDHPAVFVTWEEAKAYCEWTGGRLPTEAEREKAARGTDGRKYPWGNEEPNPQRAVFRRNWGEAATDPVEAHLDGASPYGLLDMGGNVWEWVADWWDGKYFEASPRRDPKGPRTGRAHVVKGGSWDSRPSVLSASSRNFGYRGYREGDFGFRCAMDHAD